jgi:hypothetical protein
MKDIYSPITITEDIERQFRPTRLAVKELNGVKYLCKSVKSDFDRYTGSGEYWKKIVKKYGKKNIKTLWVSDWFTCPHHIQQFALMYSEYNQVVESDEWANLKAENGIDGGAMSRESVEKTLETKRQNGTMNSSNLGVETKRKNGTLTRSPETRRKIFESKLANGSIGRTEESLAKQRETMCTLASNNFFQDNPSHKKIECPHCSKVVTGSGAYSRWHGDNCKSKPT